AIANTSSHLRLIRSFFYGPRLASHEGTQGHLPPLRPGDHGLSRRRARRRLPVSAGGEVLLGLLPLHLPVHRRRGARVAGPVPAGDEAGDPVTEPAGRIP